jgi:hypothetical protein
VISVIWFALSAYIGYEDFKAERDRWGPPIDEILSPVDSPVRREPGERIFDRRDGHC